jgi:hypothetical protein
MKIVGFICVILLVVNNIFAIDVLKRSEFFREKIKRDLKINMQASFKQQNLSLYLSEQELFQYHLGKTPYLHESPFLFDVVELFPWEIYEKYVSNRIFLYSFYGYVNFSIDLKKYDSQLLQFSIPFEKIDFLNLFKIKK